MEKHDRRACVRSHECCFTHFNQCKARSSCSHKGIHDYHLPAAPAWRELGVGGDLFRTCFLTSWIGLSYRANRTRDIGCDFPPGQYRANFGHSDHGDLPPRPRHYGVSASQDEAGMALADATVVPSGAQSLRAVAPSRATISGLLTACVAAWPAPTFWKSSRPDAFLVRLPRVLEPPPAMRPNGG